MEPPDNSIAVSNIQTHMEDEPPPVEPVPGPVDPNVLAEKLQELAQGQSEASISFSRDSVPLHRSFEDIAAPRATNEPQPLEETNSIPEEPLEILIEQEKKHFSDESDEEADPSDSEELMIYGNVKVNLPSQKAIIQREEATKTTIQTEILHHFCLEKVPEITVSRGKRLDVECFYWDKSFSCPKCPGEFNCTCELEMKDIMIKLTNAFEIVLVSDNRCTICLQIIDVLRKRRTIFCQVNIDNQDSEILEDLRNFLEKNEDSFLSSQIQHHWSHENLDANSAEVRLLGETIKLPIPDYLDIIVIGTNAAALSICEEAESCGVSVGIIDLDSAAIGSLWGFQRTYSGYGHALKIYLLEAARAKDALRVAPFSGIEITEKATLDWKNLRINAIKCMNTLAWKRRVDFLSKGVLYIAGSPKLIDRNTIQVASQQGILTFHAKYIVYAPECDLIYDHFPGLHRYCYRMHKILSYSTIEFSKTLIYGSTITALEYGGIFNYLGFDVTIMMDSKLHVKYDSDMIQKLTDHMKKNGVNFINDCRIYSVMPVPRSSCGSASIPNVMEKLMVIGQYVQTGKYRRDYFDNVILIPKEEPHYNVIYGLEEIGVQFCKYNPKMIVVDKNFKTSVSNIYAVGSIVPGMQDPTKLFDNLGRHILQSISTNTNTYENVDTKFHAVYSPVEYAFYGLSENLARSLHEKVVVYHTLYEPYELALVPLDLRIPCYMKLICLKEESQKRKREIILGFHVVGCNAVKIVNSYSPALSEGLTKDKLDNVLSVDFVCSSAAISLEEIKKVDDPVLFPGGCCT